MIVTISKNIISDLLFVENLEILKVATYINKSCLKFMGLFFLMAIIIEMFSSMDFKGVVYRTFMAFLVMAVFETALVKGVDTSFKFASRLIKVYAPNNALVVGWKNSLRTAKKLNAIKKSRKRDVSFFDRYMVLAKTLYQDSLSFLTWVFTYMAFILLQNIYSVIFYLLYTFIGISSALSILNVTKDSLKGAMQTYLVLLITPIVSAIVIILMGSNVEFATTSAGTIVTNLQALIQLCIVSIVLLLSPVIATALLFGTGLHHVGNKLAMMGAISNFSGLQRFLVQRGQNFTRNKFKMASKVGGFGAGALSNIGHGIGNLKRGQPFRNSSLKDQTSSKQPARESTSSNTNKVEQSKGQERINKEVSLKGESTKSSKLVTKKIEPKRDVVRQESTLRRDDERPLKKSESPRTVDNKLKSNTEKQNRSQNDKRKEPNRRVAQIERRPIVDSKIKREKLIGRKNRIKDPSFERKARGTRREYNERTR